MIGQCNGRGRIVRDDRDLERAWGAGTLISVAVVPASSPMTCPGRSLEMIASASRPRSGDGSDARPVNDGESGDEPDRTAVNSANQAAVVQVAEVAANRVDRDAEFVGGAVRGDSLLGGDTIEQPLVAGCDEFDCLSSLHEDACYRTRMDRNVHDRSRLGAMSSTLPSSNPDVRITGVDVLSDAWYTLRRVAFDYRDAGGRWSAQEREAYDRGNGATILLIDWDRRSVVLTRQFRMPAYLNGHVDGVLIETAAGLLDDEDAETAIRREVEEETGYRVRSVRRLFELFMSPGSVTERVAFFVAEYTAADRISIGGGVADEDEHIEVVELGLDDAVDLIDSGEICDGKTILLLQWAQLHDRRRGSLC